MTLKKEIGKRLSQATTGSQKYRNKRVRDFAKGISYKSILEIGSGTTSFKDFFNPTNRFICSDVKGRHGHMELDVTNFKMPKKLDIILLMNVLEHVPEFWKAIPNCYKALKYGGGKLFIISPMFYPLHNEPEDYWRITEHGWTFLLKEFEKVEISYNGLFAEAPFNYCVVATK